MRLEILKPVGARLKKLRKHLNFDMKQMASRLGIVTNTYYKNENGLNLPSLIILKRLVDDFDLSMDWLLFGRGPMFFKEKAQKEMELEHAMKELNTQLDRERKNHEAEYKKKEEELKNQRQKASFIESRPDMKELLEYMEQDAIFYHKLMIYFQEYKIEKKKSIKKDSA
jgi:transcriptional regulator with XRE-family HTH domain